MQDEQSRAAGLSLRPELLQWAQDQGWEEFNPLQLKAFDLLVHTSDDVLLTGRPASGKTEAAFLPLLSRASQRRSGVSVLCLSPTKALINDQHRRLLSPAARIRVPVFKWHGEAPRSGKNALIQQQRGIVFMTPESLEGSFIRRANLVTALFSSLDAILIDELHDFLSGPRGHQLAALLARLDEVAKARPRRVALSGTVGDLKGAKHWLSPSNPSSVRIVEERSGGQELRSRIRGYSAPLPKALPEGKGYVSRRMPTALGQVEASLFERHRGGAHLVFAGSKRNVEELCAGLARRSDAAQVACRFRPHHGSLGKQSREQLEDQLRRGDPLTVITTTTLEVGVDIGSLDSVEQIGPPTSVTSLRQRVGRSGRRGGPSIIDMHITEENLASPVTLFDRLRLNTARALATLNLLEQRFIEPPPSDGTMLSVLFQQVLSRVKQGNGATFPEILRLVRACSAFKPVTPAQLEDLLTHLSEKEAGFLELAPDGAYVLSEKGEKLVYSPEFYAAFRTSATCEIVSDSRRVGLISLTNFLETGDTICLDGKSWQVTGFDFRKNKVSVVPGSGGRLPIFDPTGASEVHERIAQAMKITLAEEVSAEDLDPLARRHLDEGRRTYARYDLSHRRLIEEGDDCYLFTWAGSRFNNLLAKLLRSEGIVCGGNEVAVLAPSVDRKEITRVLTGHLPSLADLSTTGSPPLQGKYDRRLPEALLREDWRRRHSDDEERLHEFCRCAGQENS